MGSCCGKPAYDTPKVSDSTLYTYPIDGHGYIHPARKDYGQYNYGQYNVHYDNFV